MTNAPAINALLSRLLDRGYTEAAGRVVAAIARSSTSGILAERLSQFEAETQRLFAAGEQMMASNPVFRALQADLTDTMQRNGVLMDSIAPDLQASGADAGARITRQIALPISDEALASVGMEWVRPDAEAVARLIDFSGKPSWTNLIDGYKAGTSNVANDVFLRGIASGRNPTAIARDVRAVVEGLPVSDANTLARTLQLSSYRASVAANYAANADILEPEAIRVETLDDRICMSCVPLHGTLVPFDDPIDEHWNGRGVAVAIVKGRGRDVQMGEDWFNGLSADRQRAMMGEAAFGAWQDGAIGLPDFVERRTDPTFGPMIQEASLKGMLGDGAKRYYAQRGS